MYLQLTWCILKVDMTSTLWHYCLLKFIRQRYIPGNKNYRITLNRNSHPCLQVGFRIVVPKIFVKFLPAPLQWCFISEAAGLFMLDNEVGTPPLVTSYDFCEFFPKTFLTEHFQATSSCKNTLKTLLILRTWTFLRKRVKYRRKKSQFWWISGECYSKLKCGLTYLPRSIFCKHWYW